MSAFNEEKNIGKLILSILSQNKENFVLDKIVVVSDKSEDSTEKIVSKIKSKKITLIVNTKRIGKALSLNKIIKICKSDYLIILDADILPKNKNSLSSLIKGLTERKEIGLVSGQLIPMEGKSFIEKVIINSINIKKKLYLSLNNGNNIYMCVGAVRGFSRNFYKSFRWEKVYGEDAFSYLSCLKNGFEFKYQKESKFIYQVSSTIGDHLKQSKRFFHSRIKQKEYFSEKFVRESYKIPLVFVASLCLKEGIKRPIVSMSYLIILIGAYVSSRINNQTSATWEISRSSKSLTK